MLMIVAERNTRARREAKEKAQAERRLLGEGRRKLDSKERNRRLRAEVLDAYGNKCACCGEREREFLGLDHVHNDGAEHRREIGEGASVYTWLKRNGFPQDGRYQLLCHNCNMAKGLYGSCPHTRGPALLVASA